MLPGTPQKLQTDSQEAAKRAAPNQLTIPEVPNQTERPLEWRDDNQMNQTKEKTENENINKDILSSKEMKSEKLRENTNPVEGDFSQNHSNLDQNYSVNSKDGQSNDGKHVKESKRSSRESSLKYKDTQPTKGHLPPFPSISIVSPQGEERNASLEEGGGEGGGGGGGEKKAEKTEPTKDLDKYSHDKFIEEEELRSGESSIILSDKDSDEGSVTDDQKRALLELEQQQKEIRNAASFPFENNIKSRLHQLNEQLANEEPETSERATKVAFREDLVQVIQSPTQDYQHAKTAKAPKDIKDTKKIEDIDEELEPKKDVNGTNGETIFDMVVERDGHFDLVTPEDMTASGDNIRRQLSFNDEKTKSTRNKSRPSSAIITRNISADFRVPKTRPISHHTYRSPYGLTPEQKEIVRQKMALEEKTKKEEEEARKMREKEKREQNEYVFQCWLRRIRQHEQATRKKEEHAKKVQEKENQEKENQQKKLNEETFHKWAQSKHEQQKQEELLKCHEIKQYNSFFQHRTQEEIDRAYERWLKRKNQEIRRQKSLAKQKYRLQQRLLRRSRLIRNMTWDVCLNNSFHFTDHYGLG